MDGQIIPINFALINIVFLSLPHKEHGNLARKATN
jgi:hypothetical protein